MLGPISFGTPMVQAIMDGRKSMTRRVVIPQELECIGGEKFPFVSVEGFLFKTDGHASQLIRPRYEPGDILYVRESWRIGAWEANLNDIAVDYRNEIRREWIHVPDEERFERYVGQSIKDAQKAGIVPNGNGEYHWKVGDAPTRWRPPRFMPREVARIFLRVTGVQVQRLQDITEEAAKAEGVEGAAGYCNGQPADQYGKSYRLGFSILWDHLNAKRGYGWDVNPWVWVYEIKQITKEEAMKEVA